MDTPDLRPAVANPGLLTLDDRLEALANGLGGCMTLGELNLYLADPRVRRLLAAHPAECLVLIDAARTLLVADTEGEAG
jgi:hypothetical protein